MGHPFAEGPVQAIPHRLGRQGHLCQLVLAPRQGIHLQDGDILHGVQPRIHLADEKPEVVFRPANAGGSEKDVVLHRGGGPGQERLLVDLADFSFAGRQEHVADPKSAQAHEQPHQQQGTKNARKRDPGCPHGGNLAVAAQLAQGEHGGKKSGDGHAQQHHLRQIQNEKAQHRQGRQGSLDQPLGQGKEPACQKQQGSPSYTGQHRREHLPKQVALQQPELGEQAGHVQQLRDWGYFRLA
ncbi:hypothetical protein NW810_08515 [Synechococcus sp. W60.2]